MTGSASLVSTEALHEAVSRRLAHQSAWGMSEEEWRILVRELVDRMEERARRQSGWVYLELTKGTPLDGRSGWHHAISSVLAVIADGVHACALPMLAAVVWGKATGSPGPGFNDAARHLGRQAAAEDDLAFWVSELKAVYEPR